jgi:hypothetical protein
MMLTVSDLEAAFRAGAHYQRLEHGAVSTVDDAARDYAIAVGAHNAAHVPANALVCDQTASSYLPPNGTREDVLARAIGTLMFRCSMFAKAMQEHEGVTESVALELAQWFNEETWFWPTMNGLRAAFPILGALEDAREEAKV